MSDELTELEAKLLRWIAASDFEEVAWSTKNAAKAFEVSDDEIYDAVAALSRKRRESFQVFLQGRESPHCRRSLIIPLL